MKLDDPIALAWLAGILEGEGAFFMYRSIVNKKVYRYPCISLNMTDEDVVRRVSELFGVGIYGPYQNGGALGKKPFWTTKSQGAKAVSIMRAILPLMGARRSSKIAELLLEWTNRVPTAVARKRSCQAAVASRTRGPEGRFVVDT
jgi:hypothetical protein